LSEIKFIRLLSRFYGGIFIWHYFFKNGPINMITNLMNTNGISIHNKT